VVVVATVVDGCTSIRGRTAGQQAEHAL